MAMEIVAQHLQREASQRNLGERDVFGRSAFNRYYYATFLDVKSVLGELRKEWGNIAHATIPNVLRGTVKEELKRGRSRAQKASDSETVELCGRAIAAASELATLMERGYATRVTADYYPNIKIDFSNLFDFQLNTVKVKDASVWPNKARTLAKTILSAWKQINV